MVDACRFVPSAALQSKERSLSRWGVDEVPGRCSRLLLVCIGVVVSMEVSN